VVPGLIALIKINSNGQAVDAYSYGYQSLFVPYFTPVNASLGGAILFVIIVWLLLLPLYKKKIIIKV
jgi:predicted acyltransferase